MTNPSTGTRYDPSAGDPRIIAVLEARRRIENAFARQDADALQSMAMPDVLVNAPINRVVTLDNITARFRAGQIHYESVDTRVEFAGVRGDLVVLMGEEIVKPTENTPNAGKTVRRRFTDIWKESGGAWKLAIRQGTAYSVE